MTAIAPAGPRIRNPFLRLVLAIVLVVGTFVLVNSIAFAVKAPGSSGAVLGAIAVFLVHRTFAHRVERRPLDEFGRRGAVRELGAGLAIGTAMFTTIVVVLVAVGACTLSAGHATAGDIATILGLSLAAGLWEEILFRAVLMRLLEEGLGTAWAMAISSAFFGVAHLLSPNATLLGVVAIVFEAGVMLGAAYLLTRRLWLAIGIHVAWNFTQGGVYGIPVSGHPATGWWTATLSGPEWLTGGVFGAEASIVSVVVGLVVSVVLWRMAARRGHVRAR